MCSHDVDGGTTAPHVEVVTAEGYGQDETRGVRDRDEREHAVRVQSVTRTDRQGQRMCTDVISRARCIVRDARIARADA